ncbi:hypothetical protein P261_01950 [Lachnospiraceae bacterium TWA4]|nr:hypothetical protein P261_01950 [Lachnospiraceae bacterium TWA4]
MSTVCFDCSMGAAGDMIGAALLELMPRPIATLEELNYLGLPHTEFIAKGVESHGTRGTHLEVLVHGMEEHEHEHDGHSHEHEGHHHHHHMRLRDVQNIINSLKVPDSVKELAYKVYLVIADAESKAHECSVEEVHFHEVGAIDAIADVTVACYLMDKLHPDKVVATPIRVGYGTVHCAHGILPVPAPATANILEGMPYYAGDLKGEMCTPTGAALLKTFVNEWIKEPEEFMQVGKGIGTKDFGVPNTLKVYFDQF